ncbi:MAG: bifunctional adenosylcobinamide kinase/adenosylcobinamide-phosphate guanylyltransferase [Pseudomonadota bacterium]
MHIPSITLVIGGAASGKSAWAERFVRSSNLAKVYVATAEARDDSEMAAKIAAHRKARSGQGWRTLEAPRRLAAALGRVDAEEVGLIDCATLWLAGVMGRGVDWRDALGELIDTMEECPAPLVLVSNELGQGIVPADAATRAFRDAHGKMNQDLAAAADLVVFVTAGIGQVLKGRLP